MRWKYVVGMNNEAFLEIIVAILSAGLTITLTLLGILFSWLKTRIDKNEEQCEKQLSEFKNYVATRLRTLGHEDRDIRNKIDGIWQLFLSNELNKDKDKGRKG